MLNFHIIWLNINNYLITPSPEKVILVRVKLTKKSFCVHKVNFDHGFHGNRMPQYVLSLIFMGVSNRLTPLPWQPLFKYNNMVCFHCFYIKYDNYRKFHQNPWHAVASCFRFLQRIHIKVAPYSNRYRFFLICSSLRITFYNGWWGTSQRIEKHRQKILNAKRSKRWCNLSMSTPII